MNRRVQVVDHLGADPGLPEHQAEGRLRGGGVAGGRFEKPVERAFRADIKRARRSTALPADQFHREQHARVAWMFVRDHGMPAALGEFTAAIKRFADAKGAHGLYHETITWAFLLIIAERLAHKPADTWEAFAGANPDLLTWKPSILERYYSKALLASDLARRSFVMPDRLQ